MVARAHRNDPAAAPRATSRAQVTFEQVIREHDEDLRRLAYFVVRDRDRMEDVLQEAYLKAFRALPRLKGDARALRSWLMRIVYNAGIDELRRARRRPSVSLDETRHDHTVEVADDAGDRELEAALEALPAEGRAVVLLVDVYGFDYRETARVLGIREGTVGSRLHRARRELRAAIEEEGGVP